MSTPKNSLWVSSFWKSKSTKFIFLNVKGEGGIVNQADQFLDPNSFILQSRTLVSEPAFWSTKLPSQHLVSLQPKTFFSNSTIITQAQPFSLCATLDSHLIAHHQVQCYGKERVCKLRYDRTVETHW